MKNKLIKDLAGIVLAGSLALNSFGQKREYLNGNVHDINYTNATEKDFPKYKIEEQFLFNNCYTFWNNAPKTDELNFSITKCNDETKTFQEGKQLSVEAPKYTPLKLFDEIDVTNLAIKKPSLERLKRRAKSKQDFGFSVDITDSDLKFNLPEIDINGTEYIVLNALNNVNENTLPLYLIPKTRGTKIKILTQGVTNGNYSIQATIICDETSGVYMPVAKNKMISGTEENYPTGVLEEKVEKTDYMKYKEREEQASKKSDCAINYTIKSGNTYWNIAESVLGNGKRAGEIQNLNNNIKPNELKVGQKIKIPCK